MFSSKQYQERLLLIRKVRDIASTTDDLPVPQICVVGDQSAGKSSFLSRLTGVSFPSAAKMCTKVATVVTCVHDNNLSSIIFKIEKWDSPGNYIEVSKSDLALKISSTQKSMLERKDGNKDDNLIVSDLEIKLTVSGPDVIDIIIVDLPGIQHKGPMKEMINDLIEKYLKKVETLICVVSEAKQDDELCQAIELATNFDPRGERTIRILSKFDNFDSDETKERAIHNVSMDSGILGGPHAILSVGSETGKVLAYGDDGEAEESKQLEEEFQLSKHRAGIMSLKQRLKPIFANLIEKTLPNLKQSVIEILKDTNRELDEVGREEVSGKEMIHKCLNALRLHKTKIQKDISKSFKIFKEDIHDTEKVITFEFSTENLEQNCFKCVLFQGDEEFNDAIAKIRDLWEPILRDYMDKVIEITNQSISNILNNDKNTKSFRNLLPVINNEFQQYVFNHIIPEFKNTCIDRLNKESFFGTINHYFDAKLKEEEFCPQELQKLLRSKLLEEGEFEEGDPEEDDHYVSVSLHRVMLSLKEAKEEIANRRRSQDLLEAQKRRLHAAVLANFAVEKKTFTDYVLKETTQNIVTLRNEWLESRGPQMLHSDMILNAAQEDDSVRERRRSLGKKIVRLKSCLEELKSVSLASSELKPDDYSSIHAAKRAISSTDMENKTLPVGNFSMQSQDSVNDKNIDSPTSKRLKSDTWGVINETKPKNQNHREFFRASETTMQVNKKNTVVKAASGNLSNRLNHSGLSGFGVGTTNKVMRNK